MTTEPSSSESRSRDPLDQDDPTIWSQRLLDWNPVDPASSRAELLRRLTERDYFLTRDETDAALFIVSPDSPELTTRIREQFAVRGTSVRLKDSVRRFAQEFFDLPFMERLVQFNELKVLCAEEPYLMAWLDGLSSGLDVERPPAEGDDAFDRLVMSCVEIFVASPREASRKRQEFIHASREEPDFWGRAAIKLHLNHNQFTMRAAAWTRTLADWQQVERRYQQTIEQLNRALRGHADPDRGNPAGHVHTADGEFEYSQDQLIRRRKQRFDRVGLVWMVIAVLIPIIGSIYRNANVPQREPIPGRSQLGRPGQIQPPDYPRPGPFEMELKAPLLLSPEELKADIERRYIPFKRQSQLDAKQKNDSAGKSNRSESNDR